MGQIGREQARESIRLCSAVAIAQTSSKEAHREWTEDMRHAAGYLG